MSAASRMIEFVVDRPRFVTFLMILITLLFALAAGLPSLLPGAFGFLPHVAVDTDPENMLPADEPVRIFHNAMKAEMALYDMIVLGVVNERHPDGVFNPDSLRRIFELTEFAKTLRWDDPGTPGEKAGVITVDLIAPSTVDNIEQGGVGVVTFEWLMPRPPETRAEALAVRHKAERIPFLDGTLLSEDGKAICIYLPITSKDVSYRIYSALNGKIATFSGDEQYFITGLPVAQDTFGVEMFKQMAVSAPIAMFIIFLVMLFFFRKVLLIVSPLIVAMVSVICTMGLLVVTGNTIHIMSSMIPIFIMPIAVLDAVHILSEFFDRYQETRDRRKTMIHVMDTLFNPMLFTSITTAVGFASLALTPIPPVQTFGLFVAFGVLMAWLWTVTFVPAFIQFIPVRALENFGLAGGAEKNVPQTPLTRFLGWIGGLTFHRARLIMILILLIAAGSAYGISRINIDDNPTKWFNASHPIRVADKVLNEHFGGTYMAYLAFEAKAGGETPAQFAAAAAERMAERGRDLEADVEGAAAVFGELAAEAARAAAGAASKDDLIERLEAFARGRGNEDPDRSFAWDEALLFVDEERTRGHVFKDPAVLEYIASLQKNLLETGIVGKSNSLSDIVKTVHRELISGEEEDFRIPATPSAVAQCLMQYQNSHRPQDLWHFVTPDFRKTVLWVQLRSGDNSDMSRVVEEVERYVAGNPPPVALAHQWFGLTYINVIWQDKMVSGMLNAFLGSFLIVFLMMTLVYRSSLWGLLSMIPLTVTIGVIYGLIGLIGKDYDMPVAVLSSLSLGLAIDYAIHFLSRSRSLREKHGSWAATYGPVFGEPARAIARNVVVVGVGFLPLLAAPLMPYKTVGMLIAAILFIAGVASLMILPALIRLLERWLFPETGACRLACKCGTCVFTAAAIVGLAVINVARFLELGWTALTWISAGAILILAAVCCFVRRPWTGPGGQAA